MAPRRVRVNKCNYNKLTANEVICPICRNILIKPITLPCSHGFCSSCFEATTQNGNVICPLCRVRIGSWLRSATKSKKLINEPFWQAIQTLFPLQVKNRLNGVDTGDKYIKQTPNNVKEDVGSTLQELKVNNNNENKLAIIPSSSNINSNILPKNQKQLPSKTNLTNFANKEYTCRIVCQNVSSKESLTLIQKKNKRIQKITEAEAMNDRSNSIESECLYFKPIDYRHNPPSEGLAPIKVPSRKPNINPNFKILAPCGQNKLNLNHLESAFARLFSSVEVIDSEQTTSHGSTPTKRKLESVESKSKKKLRNNKNITKQLNESKEVTSKSNLMDNNEYCDDHFQLYNSNNNVKKSTIVKHIHKNLLNEENIKKSLQEKADFEFATKLQQKYNQSSKYSTRSSVLKRATANKEVKMGALMCTYKVN